MPKEPVNGVLSHEGNWCLSAATEGEVTVQTWPKVPASQTPLGPLHMALGGTFACNLHMIIFAAVGESSY